MVSFWGSVFRDFVSGGQEMVGWKGLGGGGESERTRTVVFGVVVGVLDCVAPTDCGGVVVGVAFVGGEVDFFEELGFVVLEPAD